jgi:hypothetical protein
MGLFKMLRSLAILTVPYEPFPTFSVEFCIMKMIEFQPFTIIK